MTLFQEKVHKLAQRIPKGKVATYGQLAKMVGRPRAGRAVGACMRANPNARVTPCHRVVAADGRLAGYAFGKGIPTKKRKLLKEGVFFVGEKVDLKRSQWKAI